MHFLDDLELVSFDFNIYVILQNSAKHRTKKELDHKLDPEKLFFLRTFIIPGTNL